MPGWDPTASGLWVYDQSSRVTKNWLPKEEFVQENPGTGLELQSQLLLGRSGRRGPRPSLTRPVQNGWGWLTRVHLLQAASTTLFPALGYKFRPRYYVCFRISDEGLFSEAGVAGSF